MSVPPRTYDVAVATHAKTQARARFPGFKAARIVDEVRLALAAGRVSPEKPPGLVRAPDPRALYAWTEDGERVYVLHHGPSRFFVITTLRKGVDGLPADA